MSAITLFDLNGEQRFTGTSVGGGGAQPSLLTFDLTSDPNTYLFPDWEHDFGRVTPTLVAMTVLALVADGETWGAGMGQIAAFPAGAAANFEAQRDSTPIVPGWTALAGAWSVISGNVNDAFDTVGQYEAFTTTIPQCIRTRPNPGGGLGIFQNGGSGALYAGPHHPTMTVRYAVETL